MILLRWARRWWWLLPVWAILEYVVAPVVVGVLAPVVFGELLPRLAERLG